MEIKKWSWLVFPLLVGVAVVFLFSKLVSGPDQIWRKLLVSEEKVKAEEIEMEKLKSKLERLNKVDIASQRKILEGLEKAVPSQVQTMLLIGEITTSASESGVAVEKYRIVNSGTQQAVEVTLQTGDAGKLIVWINNMEKWLPMARIVSISYGEGRAEVIVEQVWKEFVVSGAKPGDELPETGEKVKAVIDKMAGYRELTAGVTSLPADDGVVNPNPF